MMSGIPPLQQYLVVDLSSGIAGGYCTKMLADAGAEVVKLEPPEGDALRRWSASGAHIAADDDGALFQFLGCSKRSVVIDPASAAERDFACELTSRADAVVWSPGSRLAEHPAFSPSTLRDGVPHAIVAAITPFGLDGPWSSRAATEFTLQAWSGGIGPRGTPERAPVSTGGRAGEWLAGMFATVGMLAARHRTLRTGIGELLDVSVLESLILTQNMYPVTFFSIAGRPHRRGRGINLPAVERTNDGWVGFMIVTAQQWHDFCVLVERPDWIEDKSLLIMENRTLRRTELQPAIASWMSSHTTAEVVERASLLRLPVAQIGNGATVTGFDHLVEKNFYVRNPRGHFLQPEVPYRLGSGAGRRGYDPAPRLGEHNAHYRQHSPVSRQRKTPADGQALLPFEGLLVADFTAFWAGPIVGHLLAMLGADVIHVESAKRPDGMRMNTVKTVRDAQWWEWAPLFHGPNTNKRDLTLDLQTERGRELARRLISKCDLLLENYSPRVLEHWGLGYDEVRKLRADIIMVRMPAFGLSGPWRDRTGYAQTMEQVSGMAWITGYRDQAPQIPNGPCDPIAGTHTTVALMLALEYRRRTGKGMLVEVPMVGGALNIAAEQVVEFSAYGNLLERDGNRATGAAPQNLYLSADRDERGRQDRWIALAIETDAQWEALRTALGDPSWAKAERLATMRGRRAAQDSIDRELGAWCEQNSSDEIITRLWPAGVPVARVIMPHELAENPQLQARSFFEQVPHPVTGVNLHGGYPVRFSAGPQRLHRRHAPTLGQDNEAILREVLGLAPDEIQQLEQDGIIGNAPQGALSRW